MRSLVAESSIGEAKCDAPGIMQRSCEVKQIFGLPRVDV